ncbi:MFS transporter [Streptomyces pacificus]|uniref:MFS transporter n=1 Tax=Streptomyces pacificus TaxID=2705029 RepID=UPI0015658507|nr:MFS transporter [Streptomyces pacificus]
MGPSRTASRVSLAILVATQFYVMLTGTVVNITLPVMGEDLGLAPTLLPQVVGAYVLATAALLLPAGRAADRFGRRRLLLVGLAVSSFASCLVALSGDATTLIAARAFQGAGIALVQAALLALFLLRAPEGERARPLGLWGMATLAGGGVGVLFSGLLTEVAGWRYVFFAIAAFAALLAPLCAVTAPSDGVTGDRVPRRDLVSLVVLASGLVLLAFGTAEAGRWGSRPQALVPAGGGLALLALLIALERGRPNPLIPLRVFAGASVRAAQVGVAVLGMAATGMFFLLPLYQQRVLGDSPGTAALWQVPLTVASSLGSVFAARLGRRLGSRTALALGQTVLAAGLLWMGRLKGERSFGEEALLPSLLMGAGLGVALVHMVKAATAGADQQNAGVASGLTTTVKKCGGVFGLTALGSLAAAVTETADPGLSQVRALQEGYAAAFTLLGALVAATALLVPLAPLLGRIASRRSQRGTTADSAPPRTAR